MNRTTAMVASRLWQSLAMVGAFFAIGHALTPESFGLFALASSLALLPHAMVGAGFYEWVLSRRGEDADDDTAFWCAAIMGALAAALICGVAALMQRISNDVSVLLTALSLQSLFWGLCVTREAELLRDGKGRAVACALVTVETVGLVLLVVGLWMGYGIAALVLSRIANQGVLVLAYAIASRKVLARSFSFTRAKRMTRYSIGVLASNIIGWADGYGGDMVIAGLISHAGLGVYRMGGRLYHGGANVLLSAPAAAQIAFTSAACAKSEARMQRVSLRTMRLHCVLVAPLFAGLAATAHYLVPLLLGPAWAGTATIVALFCLGAPAVILANAYSAVLLARGATKKLFWVCALSMGATLTALAGGALVSAEMAAGARAVAAVAFSLAAVAMLRVIDPALVRQAALSFAAISLSALVLASTTALLLLPSDTDSHPITQLAHIFGASVAGVGVYVAVLRAIAPRSFSLAYRIVRRSVRRAAPDERQAVAY